MLLQNADDAGASSLTLMLDLTTYPANSILGPAMAMWQVRSSFKLLVGGCSKSS